jgi:hypothetical protein
MNNKEDLAARLATLMGEREKGSGIFSDRTISRGVAGRRVPSLPVHHHGYSDEGAHGGRSTNQKLFSTPPPPSFFDGNNADLLTNLHSSVTVWLPRE